MNRPSFHGGGRLTIDEAIEIMTPTAWNAKTRLEIYTKHGNPTTAYEEAVKIAVECMKRCRDFHDILEALDDDKR